MNDEVNMWLENISQFLKKELSLLEIELKKGNYPLAKTILEALWNDSNKDDEYLLYDYGKALRKVKESIKFVEICRELNTNKHVLSNKWIVSTFCWVLYDCYIKNYSITEKHNFN